MITRLLLLCLALTALPAVTHAQESWATYRNTRFGTSVEYPSRFRPGRPPENNDGLGFTAADGATLAVWGSLNIEAHDIKGLEAFLRESLKAGERITYRAAGRDWLVISGTQGDRIFYRRYLLSHRNDVVNAFAIVYPANLAANYDPVVARISKSLRPGRGYQVPGNP